MQSSQSNLLTRSDTLLGVCQALGDDFGFNPLLLRIGFAVLLLWSPAIVIGAYLGAGIVVAVSRLLFPHPRTAAVQVPTEQDPAEDADDYAMAA